MATASAVAAGLEAEQDERKRIDSPNLADAGVGDMRALNDSFLVVDEVSGNDVNVADGHADSERVAVFRGQAMAVRYHIVVEVSADSGQRLSEISVARKTILGIFERVYETFSKFNPNSEVRRLFDSPVSSSPQVSLSTRMAFLLQLVDVAVRVSRGRYDPTVAPLVDAWHAALDASFPSARVTREALEERFAQVWKLVQPHVGWSSVVELVYNQRNTSDLPEFARPNADGVVVDLGGAAKGYCVDWLCEELTHQGFSNCYVDWGGDIGCRGVCPQVQAPGFRLWRTALAEPPPLEFLFARFAAHSTAKAPGNSPPLRIRARELKHMGTVDLNGEDGANSLAASGDFQQLMKYGCSHIAVVPSAFVPTRPLVATRAAIAFVAISAKSCAAADAAATAAMTFGEDVEGAVEMLDRWNLGLEADLAKRGGALLDMKLVNYWLYTRSGGLVTNATPRYNVLSSMTNNSLLSLTTRVRTLFRAVPRSVVLCVSRCALHGGSRAVLNVSSTCACYGVYLSSVLWQATDRVVFAIMLQSDLGLALAGHRERLPRLVFAAVPKHQVNSDPSVLRGDCLRAALPDEQYIWWLDDLHVDIHGDHLTIQATAVVLPTTARAANVRKITHDEPFAGRACGRYVALPPAFKALETAARELSADFRLVRSTPAWLQAPTHAPSCFSCPSLVAVLMLGCPEGPDFATGIVFDISLWSLEPLLLAVLVPTGSQSTFGELDFPSGKKFSLSVLSSSQASDLRRFRSTLDVQSMLMYTGRHPRTGLASVPSAAGQFFCTTSCVRSSFSSKAARSLLVFCRIDDFEASNAPLEPLLLCGLSMLSFVGGSAEQPAN